MSQTANPGGKTQRDYSFVTFQWRVIAGILSLLTVAALGALVIVATVKDADLLATVALSLAVLAFVIQILVFISQAWTSSQQMLQSQSLNAETKTLLTEVRTSAQGTQALVEQQFDALLKHLLGEAIPDSVNEATEEGQFDPAEFERSIKTWLSDALDEQRGARVFVPTVSEKARQLSGEDREIIRRLETFPDHNDGQSAVARLNALSPFAANLLRRLGEHEKFRRRQGRPGGLRVRNSDILGLDQLLELGLAVPVQADGTAASQHARLTDLGIETARLLTARGQLPDYLEQGS